MTTSPERRKFDIRYDVYGRGEPGVVLYKPDTMAPGETFTLSEAERRGIVSKEQADQARKLTQHIWEVTKKVRGEVESGKGRRSDGQR